MDQSTQPLVSCQKLRGREGCTLSYNRLILPLCFYLLYFATPLSVNICFQEYQWKVGIFIMFCSWFQLLLHHPVYGTYLSTMLKVVKKLGRFTIMYIIFLLMFSLSFYALLRNQVRLLPTILGFINICVTTLLTFSKPSYLTMASEI